MTARALRGARAAVAFLTRVPVGGEPYDPEELRWACAYFPAVGAVIGGTTGLLFHLLGALTPGVAAVVAVAATVFLTGALHEDGLADTADALGGAYTRERLFEILKDSRIGTYGGAALVLSLLLRTQTLAVLGSAAPLACVLTATWARVGPVWLMWRLDYVSPGSAAKSRDLTRAQGVHVAVASATALAVSAIATWYVDVLPLLAMIGVSAAVTLLCGWRFVARAGGVTGDFLGATEQLTEVALMLVWVALR